MTHDDITTLFQYHAWAHERMLSALDRLSPDDFTRTLGGSFASIRDTVAHMLLADELWYARWRGASPTTFPPYDSIPDVATARERWRAFGTQVGALLEELGDDGLQRTFTYRLKSGAAGASTYADAMQHVVNHGTYHRGQVTTLVRQLGYPPPASLDLIAFYRERP